MTCAMLLQPNSLPPGRTSAQWQNLWGIARRPMLLKHYQYVMDGQKRNAVETLPDLAYVPKPMCPKDEAATALQ